MPLKQNCPFVSAERAWISIPGQVASVSGLEAARAAPFVKDVFPRAGAGNTVVFPQNNVEKCGNVLSAAPSHWEAVEASEAACRKIILRLKPHVAETDAFLATLHSPAEQQTFPPNVLQFAAPLAGAARTASFAVASGDTGAGASFEQLLSNAVYTEKDGFVLPDFLAAVLDSARDLQGRTLRELLRQSLDEEPGLASILCVSKSADSQRKNGYWKALIRGGLQGLLYRYDCEKV